MSINLLICSVGFGAIILISIIYLLIKKKVNVKFALVWIILFVILITSILIPGFLEWLTEILGFQTASNMILSIFIAVLIAINIALTVALSNQSKKVISLAKKISLLESKNNK